jgi:hypothetical protein
MDYFTSLIERSKDDENGQRLSDMINAELTFLSNNGLDNFMLVPIQNAGRTVSVIIAARGENPTMKGGLEAFRELTGLDSFDDLDLSGGANQN